MEFSRQVEILRHSGLVHGDWYRQTYPDVAELGIHPAVHYLRYGAAMGRDPGKSFSTRDYLRAYPDVARAGMNPLLHYILHGRAEGRQMRPDAAAIGLRAVDEARRQLLGMGFTAGPLADLARLAAPDAPPAQRAAARLELALWEMRLKGPEALAAALAHLDQARAATGDADLLARLDLLAILCLHGLGARDRACAVFEAAEAAGRVMPDLMLARANLDPAPEDRLGWMNRAMAAHGLPPLALTTDAGLPAYDRLACAVPVAPVTDGPMVTVLVAAYAAEATLGTTLRGLSAQSWRNLDILVLDDCSPDGTCEVALAHAARDPRIRLIRMARNGGAYVARNRGLDEARGEFVTLNDADDWSHPLKIETQVRHLIAHPEHLACTSQQARAMSDLAFLRWTGRGRFIIHNTSSLMFRRDPMRARLGYWDTVRFSADSELIRRMQRVFGARCVADLDTGPLSFQRDSETSILTDPVMGMNGFYYGVRKEYFDAQRFHHARAGSLRYGDDPARRPFPVPPMMRPERKALLAAPQHLDLVIAGDFRQPGPGLSRALELLRAARAAGRSTGLVELYEPGIEAGGRKRMHDDLRAEVDGQAVRVLVYGESVSCDRLEHLSGTWDLRFLPEIRTVE